MLLTWLVSLCNDDLLKASRPLHCDVYLGRWFVFECNGLETFFAKDRDQSIEGCLQETFDEPASCVVGEENLRVDGVFLLEDEQALVHSIEHLSIRLIGHLKVVVDLLDVAQDHSDHC